jgi:hypothetical protein
LEIHAEAALRSLIGIAEKYDWGQAALDDYVAFQKLFDEAWAEVQEDAEPETADEPTASPESKADGDGELRERLAATLARLKISQDRFANHASVSQACISKFLAGKTLSHRNRPKIEAALTDLASY